MAVWRLSGPAVPNILEDLLGRRPRPRYAERFHWREDGGAIDDGLLLYFPSPRSVTGEDVGELHLHASPALDAKVSELLTARGLRLAQAGEFTLRALRNGKTDLLAAEGLGALLDAETELQRQQAQAIKEGAAQQQMDEWRRALISALAFLEVGVDFPDEEDVPSAITDQAIPTLQKLRAEIDHAVTEGVKGRRLHDGVCIAILGPPNAGKSSLLNKLAGEDRVIVSPVAGTTRDIISIRMNIANRLVEVLDTAGLRSEAGDDIEEEGIRRAEEAARSADLVIWCNPYTDKRETLPATATSPVLKVATKADLPRGWVEADEIALSVQSGDGWAGFLSDLEAHISALATPSLFPKERQLAKLRVAVRHLDEAMAGPTDLPEVLAAEVRSALVAFDELDGRATTEAVLGEIFSSFCIGK